MQEKWANFHGSWGKRSSAEPDYEEIDTAIEQALPVQPVRDIIWLNHIWCICSQKNIILSLMWEYIDKEK